MYIAFATWSKPYRYLTYFFVYAVQKTLCLHRPVHKCWYSLSRSVDNLKHIFFYISTNLLQKRSKPSLITSSKPQKSTRGINQVRLLNQLRSKTMTVPRFDFKFHKCVTVCIKINLETMGSTNF